MPQPHSNDDILSRRRERRISVVLKDLASRPWRFFVASLLGITRAVVVLVALEPGGATIVEGG